MSQTTLRNYLNEIKSLIEGQKTEEARQRCLHVLQSFPKNISAYRLMGQASLESEHYAEAADIFLRLLSSLPGDFIAHLGLSLIREQEGKVEAAAWHMARALEIKPGSQTLQHEISRLTAIQTGQPPQPAPLTRAALARLYLQGGCYPQAIAEIQSAQAEDPPRYDLLVLAAEAYEQAGLPDQAIQASQAALQKLPYSLQANRILFEAALRGSSPDLALTYRQRLQKLDPYWAYVTPGTVDPALVPDQMVMLEMVN